MAFKRILVTGAGGFIGQNLLAGLSRHDGIQVFPFDRENSAAELESFIDQADFIFHLAGVNRPETEAGYRTGNAGFTADLIRLLQAKNKIIPILFTSSIQAASGTPYGLSKKEAEDMLLDYRTRTGATIYIYRLPNVFGKWSRPNYNSVVATFCHNHARGLEIHISDPQKSIGLVYIDDVINSFLARLTGIGALPNDPFVDIGPVFTLSLGELAAKIKQFKDIRQSGRIPDFSAPFNRCLYATFVSFLPTDDLAYPPGLKSDSRGHLFEWLRSEHFGQVFVSVTKPGITRGHHFHHTKIEKFCVLSGQAEIKFRHIFGKEVLTYKVSGDKPQVVDIPPGYTHSLTNTGPGDLITLFWASEIYDPQETDTHYLEV